MANLKNSPAGSLARQLASAPLKSQTPVADVPVVASQVAEAPAPEDTGTEQEPEQVGPANADAAVALAADTTLGRLFTSLSFKFVSGEKIYEQKNREGLVTGRSQKVATYALEMFDRSGNPSGVYVGANVNMKTDANGNSPTIGATMPGASLTRASGVLTLSAEDVALAKLELEQHYRRERAAFVAAGKVTAKAEQRTPATNKPSMTAEELKALGLM